ncbi:MAG TPA: hypothetical protein VFX61_08490 [Micromonosporaceae bacterium]|nr:hypothetical protein [Micromonosporaceae bacterium]
MRRLRNLLIVVVLAGLGLFVGPAMPACACSCAEAVSPEEAAERSDAVFVGVVKKIDRPWGLIRSSTDPVTVTIDVTEVHKGDVPATVKVVTEADGASCGYEFVDGGRYLVFASGKVADLRTGLCDGNRNLASESNPFTDGHAPRVGEPESGWGLPFGFGAAAAGLAVAGVGVWWWRRRPAGAPVSDA